MEDLQPLLFHQIKFTHGQLGEVFLHGEEAAVGEALHVFRPGTKQNQNKKGNIWYSHVERPTESCANEKQKNEVN